MSLYSTLTEHFIAALEAGTPPWVQPWSRGDPWPRSAVSGRPYQGINVLVLTLAAAREGYADPRWLTFRQARAAGAWVRRGETSQPILVFKSVGKVEPEPPLPAAADAASPSAPRRFARLFRVFNVDQLEGWLGAEIAPPPVYPTAATVLRQSRARIRHGGHRAAYVPSRDVIHLPPPEAFRTVEDYYATALHELVHWSGAPGRLQRLPDPALGVRGYAVEELVAELGAAFLCARCRIDGQLQHAEYLAGWVKLLRAEPRLLVTCASQAQRAADWLLQRAGVSLDAED